MNNDYSEFNICCKEDEFINSKREGEARWVVTLNNGLVVFQDDDRPGLHIRSAWERLNNYCKLTKDYIISMYIQFRSHVEHLEKNADGYYFCKSILGEFGSDKNFHFFVVGTLKNGILVTQQWKIPELIPYEEPEERAIKEDDICLIKRR